MMTRADGRLPHQLRTIELIPDFQKDAYGSVLIKWGKTHVACSVMVDERVPKWMNGQPGGWITAEYGMLPASSGQRIDRDRVRSTGRTHEIQRLIGRSIRACTDLKRLGTRTFQIDCDVIQADGGTRVASICGAYLAFRLALRRVKFKETPPPIQHIAAVSIGKVQGQLLLDLDYSEDVQADVDANIVMNSASEFVELQGTAERGSFSVTEWAGLQTMAIEGIKSVFEIQESFLKKHLI